MKSITPLIFWVLTLVLSLPSCRPGEISLRLHPKDGSRYRVLFRTNGNIGITVAGRELNTGVETGISSTLRVDTLNGNRYRFALTYEDFDINPGTGKTGALPDSAGKKNLGKLVRGVSFTAIVNEHGKAEEMKAGDSLRAIIDSSITGMSEKDRRQVMATLGPLLSDDMARGMIDQCFYVFPMEKVNVGDSWKNEIVMQSIFSMVMKSTFTLVEIKDSIAKLAVHSVISPNNNEVVMPGLAMNSPKGLDPGPVAPGLDLMGVKLTASFEGKQDGNVWINMNTGMIECNLVDQDLKGKISVSLFDMPMTLKMKTGYSISVL